MESLNLISGEKYSIPSALSDRENIDAFLQQHTGKKVVVVQGLGFVGAVMSLIVANALTEEYAVIGIDLPNENSYWKIRSINEGLFPVSSSDKKIDSFYAEARRKNNLLATYDAYVYSLADVVIVDINLDVNKNSDENKVLKDYEVNLNGFKKAIETIALSCKQDVLVLVETTVPPGTCKKIVAPIFEAAFKKRKLEASYRIGHSYERVMPGPGYVDSIQNFYRVYSGINEESAVSTEKFLKTIIHTNEYPLTRLQSTNATEMAKVLENSFRAMNIAFIQEWAEFAEEAEVNLFEVLEGIRMRPTHRNIMSPGLGVGGYCLPKDPLLASWAKQNLFNSPKPLQQSEVAVQINDRMPLHTFELILKHFAGDLKNKKIALIGISYLNNVGDTRYTPAELLYDLLKKNGAQISITDPYVNFWEERNLSVHNSIEPVLAEYPEVLVFCTKHNEFITSKALENFIFAAANLLFVDTCGLIKNEMISEIKINNTLRIIGRGDV